MQGLDDGEFFFGRLVFLQVILGAFNGELAAAEQVVDQHEVLDIHGTEKTVALPVLAGLQDIEFRFPVADQGLSLIHI